MKVGQYTPLHEYETFPTLLPPYRVPPIFGTLSCPYARTLRTSFCQTITPGADAVPKLHNVDAEPFVFNSTLFPFPYALLSIELMHSMPVCLCSSSRLYSSSLSISQWKHFQHFISFSTFFFNYPIILCKSLFYFAAKYDCTSQGCCCPLRILFLRRLREEKVRGVGDFFGAILYTARFFFFRPRSVFFQAIYFLLTSDSAKAQESCSKPIIAPAVVPGAKRPTVMRSILTTNRN